MNKSNPKKKRYFNFGRIFFPGGNNKIIPEEIRFQPLGNHVGNVKRLAKQWKLEDFSGNNNLDKEESKQRVIRGIDIHDMAKPQTFFIDADLDKNNKFKEYKYSFKGHRFRAKYKPCLWIEKLALGHHKYNLQEMIQDIYELKKYSPYQNILEQDPLAYAKELYILEMCDQIEASIACNVCDDQKQEEERTFMEYNIKTNELVDNIYYLDPYPFETTEIKLNFKYWSWKSNPDLAWADKQELEKLNQDNKHYLLGKTLDEIIKNWWKKLDHNPQLITVEATLKPYINTSSDPASNLSLNCEYLYDKLAGYTPNPMQEEVFTKITQTEHPAFIVKAPTGVGKFEAILFPALAKGYRLILPLPAKSLLEDQKKRTEDYLRKLSKLEPNKEFSLIVDTGSQMKRWIYLNGEEIKPKVNNPRRHLYKGDVILTTLDKFLYRYFAYGDNNKNYIFPLRINSKIDNRETLICFDEAHSYENLAFTNFKSLINTLYQKGRSLVLMTATMPKEIVDNFDYLQDDLIDYIDDSNKITELNKFRQIKVKQKYLNQRKFSWINNISRNQEDPSQFQNQFAEIIINQWQSNHNSRIIAVVETVKDAAAIYQKLKSEIGLNLENEEKFLYLYHGRMAEKLRPEIYKKIQERDRENKPYLLITTSAIEVGCDLNSEILITQICPPENLIQRVGRCNRKGNFENAKVIVIGDKIPDYLNSLDESGWETYKSTLEKLNTFETDKIINCISRNQHIDDYRAVELFSSLHDYVYDADLVCQPTHKKGLIPTRSWKPTVDLVYEDERNHKISISIDRLCSGEEYDGVYAYEKYYDLEKTGYKERLLSWGMAYSKNITIRISSQGSNSHLPPYQYDEELGFVELPKVFTKLPCKEMQERLLYKENKYKAIINYVKSFDIQ